VVIDGSYEIDDDRSRIDLAAVWRFLSTEAYWQQWRSQTDVRAQVEGAWRVVGCYDHHRMVGFARALSDGVALAYLADVFVLNEHRGQGIGRALVREMIEQGPGRDFRWMLHTADAHGLYREFGFSAPDSMFMERPDGWHNQQAALDQPPRS
jgi:GNAT superfamily N-acetyltransferase